MPKKVRHRKQDTDWRRSASGLGGALRAGALSGLGGALRAPLGPVVAALVPRCALLPAPTPRLMGLRQMRASQLPNDSHPARSVMVDGTASRHVGVSRIG